MTRSKKIFLSVALESAFLLASFTLATLTSLSEPAKVDATVRLSDACRTATINYHGLKLNLKECELLGYALGYRTSFREAYHAEVSRASERSSGYVGGRKKFEERSMKMCAESLDCSAEAFALSESSVLSADPGIRSAFEKQVMLGDHNGFRAGTTQAAKDASNMSERQLMVLAKLESSKHVVSLTRAAILSRALSEKVSMSEAIMISDYLLPG